MLSHWDIAIIAVYFVVVLSVGLYGGRNTTNNQDFLVASRKMPWWAVLLSIIGAEISAMTFLGVPNVGFGGNLNYLQFGIGSLLARFCVAGVFLGAFYKSNCVTIYQFLETRFGGGSRYTSSIFFIVTRLLASGVRLMVAALGISVILGQPYWLCLMVFILLTITYSSIGGIKAIIWTDSIQCIIFTSAGIAMVVFFELHIGWDRILSIASDAGKTTLFRWEPESGTHFWAWFQDPNAFVLAFINGFIMTTAALGTDQDLTQRMLTCKNTRDAQRSVILSGMIGIPIAALFLFIGLGLFAWYQVFPQTPIAMVNGAVDADSVFSYFIGNVLPVGMKGLLLAGVCAAAMSSLDSALGALSSSASIDLYRPLTRHKMNDKALMRLSRIFVVIAGALLFSVAFFLRNQTGHLWLAFQIVGITYGPLLGVFLLGLLTQRGSDKGNVIAMLSGAFLSAILLFAIRNELLNIAWTLIVLFGVCWTFFLGLCFNKCPKNR